MYFSTQVVFSTEQKIARQLVVKSLTNKLAGTIHHGSVSQPMGRSSLVDPGCLGVGRQTFLILFKPYSSYKITINFYKKPTLLAM